MNLNTTLDQVQMTEMNTSFIMAGNNSGVVVQEDNNDSFGDKLNNGEEGDNNVNLLDNLLVEENNGQMESDKQRQQLLS